MFINLTLLASVELLLCNNKQDKIVTKMFFRIILLPSFFFLQASAYCWQPGWNPSFTAPPSILQIDLMTIWISWKGLVVNSECADQVFYGVTKACN